ncbi:MAG: NAD-dependent epimerase/dehydratase family protein [Geminicoccaceae bacterium]
MSQLRRHCLVLGGTGHIGNALVRALLRDGHDVAVTCRRANGRANLDDLNITVMVGDDRKPGQIQRWTRGRDLVIDAAAPYPVQLIDPDKSRNDHAQHAFSRCRQLINAVRDHDAELVYISSFTTLRSHRHWRDRLQSAMIQGSHPYFEIKAVIERNIIAAVDDGLRAVVINPSVCLGPWDLKAPEACFVASAARGDLWGVTQQPLNVIDVRDVADMALKAIAMSRYGEPVAVSGHNIELASLVRMICQLAGQRPPAIRASTRFAAAGAYWTELMFAALGQSSPYPSLPFLLLCECQATNRSRAQQELGIRPRALDVTLRDALSWYRKIGYC